MFDFETIRPQYNVLAWTSENSVTFHLKFSDPNLQKSIQEELESKGFSTIYEFTVKQSVLFQPPSGMDTLQILERICTTLELEHYKVQRKIVPRWKLLQDVLPIQSFILGS